MPGLLSSILIGNYNQEKVEKAKLEAKEKADLEYQRKEDLLTKRYSLANIASEKEFNRADESRVLAREVQNEFELAKIGSTGAISLSNQLNVLEKQNELALSLAETKRKNAVSLKDAVFRNKQQRENTERENNITDEKIEQIFKIRKEFAALGSIDDINFRKNEAIRLQKSLNLLLQDPDVKGYVLRGIKTVEPTSMDKKLQSQVSRFQNPQTEADLEFSEAVKSGGFGNQEAEAFLKALSPEQKAQVANLAASQLPSKNTQVDIDFFSSVAGYYNQNNPIHESLRQQYMSTQNPQILDQIKKIGDPNKATAIPFAVRSQVEENLAPSWYEFGSDIFTDSAQTPASLKDLSLRAKK